MKFLLPLVVLVAACGRYEVTPQGSKVGEALPVSALSNLDRSNLSSICNALAAKQVVPGSNLTFQAFEGDCTGNTVSNGLVQTTIQSISGEFFLTRKVGGDAFIFPDLESPTKGMMESICGNLSGFENPLQTATERITYNTTGISSDDCELTNENLCVEMRRASLVDGAYIVHTKEFMRVKVTDTARTGKLGYFTQRKKVTKSYCGLNEQLTFKADLK